MNGSVDRSPADLIKKTSRYCVQMLISLILNRHQEIYLTISQPQHALRPSAVSAGKWIHCRRLMDKIDVDDLSFAILNKFLSQVIKSHVLFNWEGFKENAQKVIPAISFTVIVTGVWTPAST